MQEATCAKGEVTRDVYSGSDATVRSKARSCARCKGARVGNALHQIGNSDVYLCDECLTGIIGNVEA